MKELMKDLKNKKGFTLVELLAVIVVLAIIILIAMPAVMSAMDKARRNALVTEVNEIAKVAQTAFADKSMNATGLSDACFTLDYLVEAGYLDKKLDGYSGYVRVTVDKGSGMITKKVSISNGIYSTKNTDANANNEQEPNDVKSDQLGSLNTITTICPGYNQACKSDDASTATGCIGDKIKFIGK